MLSANLGARLNEICQLNVSDIQKQDGIWVMNLTNDSEDKSIKTEAGIDLFLLRIEDRSQMSER